MSTNVVQPYFKNDNFHLEAHGTEVTYRKTNFHSSRIHSVSSEVSRQFVKNIPFNSMNLLNIEQSSRSRRMKNTTNKIKFVSVTRQTTILRVNNEQIYWNRIFSTNKGNFFFIRETIYPYEDFYLYPYHYSKFI